MVHQNKTEQILVLKYRL